MVGVINGGVSAASLADLAVIIGDDDARADLVKQLRDSEKTAKAAWKKAADAQRKLKAGEEALAAERLEFEREVSDRRMTMKADEKRVIDMNAALERRETKLKADRAAFNKEKKAERAEVSRLRAAADAATGKAESDILNAAQESAKAKATEAAAAKAKRTYESKTARIRAIAAEE